MKNIFLVLFAVLISWGCSRHDWVAKLYMIKAENAYSKAYNLRTKKVLYEERLKLYRQACSNFLKAYHHDSRIFSLNRIEAAAESCLRAEDRRSEGEFRRFGEEYVKAHPTEAEYGDAVPLLNVD